LKSPDLLWHTATLVDLFAMKLLMCQGLFAYGKIQKQSISGFLKLGMQYNVYEWLDSVCGKPTSMRDCNSWKLDDVQMKRMNMMDSRQNPDAVKRLIGWQRNRLNDSLREMIFRAAPSARR